MDAPSQQNGTSPVQFNPNLAWFVAFIVVTVILLLVLLTIICILGYVVYRLRRKVISSPTDDIVYGFSNKHAALSEYRSNDPSTASLLDPWNTTAKVEEKQTPCDCHWLHREEFERRRSNLLGHGIQFHTYPKIGPPNGDVPRVGFAKRVLSQPASFHYLQRRISMVKEATRKPDIPKNRRVERLLREAKQGEVNLTWPREPI